jgi:chemotaxis protein CheZ
MAESSGNTEKAPLITLVEARQILEYLEDGYQDEADQIILNIVNRNQIDLFSEIGKMTRNLHNQISNFQVDPRLSDIAKNEIPDATERLRYIITMTDRAANRTMDAVDNCMPLAQQLSKSISEIEPSWDKLMHNRTEIDKNEFIKLCHKVDGLISKSKDDSQILCSQLTEILMAQDFQDLTGQMINRVIKLVSEVETKLLDLLKAFMESNVPVQKVEDTQTSSIEVEGPIVNKEQRTDVVQSQDDVDDLLASLGF